ncbi:MAG TPA: hypothetical protein PKM41_03160 [Deltaproteobacteria bacterium]|nr:hypothetical protein [Deltaproteobacteria bacterium]HOI05758.1 hypothetical protein [Deltaproteobacteria bacterium]
MSRSVLAAVTAAMVMLFWSIDGNAANRLLYENFDDGVIDGRLTVYGNSWNTLLPPQYTLNEPGRNGRDRSFTSGTVSAAHLCWKTNVPSPWPTDEFYVSFWMRYPFFVTTDPVNENLKIFYPHWDGVDSYVHYAMAQPDLVYYSARAKAAMVASGRWITCPGMTDGRWHHYEFYVKFSTGVSRFVYDGAVKVNDAYGPGLWSRNVYYFSIPSMNGRSVPGNLNPGTYTRQVDDIEIWDGMPGTKPSAPVGVRARVTG